MRFVAWSDNTDWHTYLAQVVSIRRLSRTKWKVVYVDQLRKDLNPIACQEELLIIADNVWLEVIPWK